MNLFKKKKYLDCHYMKHSIHFFYDKIKMCCTNVDGPVLYDDYAGETVDWDYVFNYRKKMIKNINSFFSSKEIPSVCNGCYEVNNFLSDKKIENFDNKINTLYFHNNMSCNAKCNYCVYSHIEKGYKYKVVPILKDLINKDIISDNIVVYMSGGEITIYPEFDELMDILQSRKNSRIEILTNSIRYSPSIYSAFQNDKCYLIISLDSGSPDTYKKIKNVDCFDKVISNISRYLSASCNASDYILLKYILIDGFNNNLNEITDFLSIANSIGVKRVRLDIDYEKYKLERNIKVPSSYFDLYDFFNKKSKELGLTVETYSQVQAILDNSR